MNLFKLKLAALVIYGSLVPSATYYVDQGAGNDSNNGTSAATAFQTVAKAQSVVTTGQSIAIYAGTDAANPYIYREMLTLPAQNISVIGWGAAHPVLAADDVIAAGAWSLVGGTTACYQASVPIDASTITWVSVWENGTRFARTPAATSASCDATPSSYYPSTDSGSGTITITLYVHTSDGSNPGSNGKTYEYSKRQQGLICGTFADQTGCRVFHVTTRRNLHNDGSLKLAQQSLAYDVTALDGTKHNIYVRPRSILVNATASGAYFGGQSLTLFIGNENTVTGTEPITYINPTATLATYINNASGIYGHSNISGQFGPVRITGGTFTNLGTAIGALDSVALSVIGPVALTGNGTDIYMDSSSNYVTDLTGTGTNWNEFLIDNVGISVEIANSTIANQIAVQKPNISVYLHDSTLQHGYPIYNYSTGGSVKSRNNSFQGGQLYELNTTCALDSDYNAFNGHPITVQMLGTTYSSLTAYRTATGQDLHSTP